MLCLLAFLTFLVSAGGLEASFWFILHKHNFSFSDPEGKFAAFWHGLQQQHIAIPERSTSPYPVPDVSKVGLRFNATVEVSCPIGTFRKLICPVCPPDSCFGCQQVHIHLLMCGLA